MRTRQPGRHQDVDAAEHRADVQSRLRARLAPQVELNPAEQHGQLPAAEAA
jgi:hypothetical protein